MNQAASLQKKFTEKTDKLDSIAYQEYLNDSTVYGFIEIPFGTPKGKAMRVGSIIARCQIPPTVRPYSDHREYCLFYSKGTCKECVPRCPVGALSESGHDKVTCRKFLSEVTAKYVEEKFKFKGYGCGLCQTGVACESGIPE